MIALSGVVYKVKSIGPNTEPWTSESNVSRRQIMTSKDTLKEFKFKWSRKS